MKQYINKKFLIWAGAIIFAAILWSLDGTLIRPNFYSFPALNIVFIEHLFGAILLSPFLFMGWKKLKKLSKKSMFDIIWICVFGGLFGTLAITEAYFAAFRWDTTFSTVIILQKLQPIFAIWLARIVLKERLSAQFYLWAWLGIASAYMIAFGWLGNDIFNIELFGNPALYAILAAFAFASSTVFGKDLVDHLGFRLTTALRFSITALLALIAVVLFGEISAITNFEVLHWQLFTLIVFTSWAAALFLYYFWLKKVQASAATIFELAWPLSGIFFDWYFNGNVLTPLQAIFSIILLLSFFMIIKQAKPWKR
jgi:drug/metabolite transporter (DMT)-like permease